MMDVWCVEWYDENDERHIECNVRDPERLRQNLVDLGMDPTRIDIYMKDVS
jgi:hypothetical protein